MTLRPRSVVIGFLLLMVLVGLNLRPALSSLAPLLGRIQEDTNLSPLAIGALTTLPVLCLGLFAPLAPWLAQRLGAERSLSLALLVLGISLLLRTTHGPAVLFFGTLLVGASIGVAGSLLPALVKRELPGAADLMTGVYTMALCMGGALGAGFSVPLADYLNDWRWSLASWAILAFIALLAWRRFMPQTQPDKQANTSPLPDIRLTRSYLAWQVTGFMGSQSSLAYIVFGWLPVLMQHRGLGEGEAGWLLAVSVMSQLLAALGAPLLARLSRDQRPAILLMLTSTGAGILLLLFAPLSQRWLGAVLLGIGQGGCFSLALALIVLRSGNIRVAGKLSGMAQGIGYSMASLGPLGVGLLLQIDASLVEIGILMGAILALATACAMLAGRNRRLEIDAEGRLYTHRFRQQD